MGEKEHGVEIRTSADKHHNQAYTNEPVDLIIPHIETQLVICDKKNRKTTKQLINKTMISQPPAHTHRHN